MSLEGSGLTFGFLFLMAEGKKIDLAAHQKWNGKKKRSG